jgi:hypothetical protein
MKIPIIRVRDADGNIVNIPAIVGPRGPAGSGDKLSGGAQIEAGSYTGTGTSGAANRNTLRFPFTPRLVVVHNPYHTSPACVMVRGASNCVSVMDGDNKYSITLEWGTDELSWYGAQSAYQLNAPGVTYHYVAIG